MKLWNQGLTLLNIQNKNNKKQLSLPPILLMTFFFLFDLLVLLTGISMKIYKKNSNNNNNKRFQLWFWKTRYPQKKKNNWNIKYVISYTKHMYTFQMKHIHYILEPH